MSAGGKTVWGDPAEVGKVVGEAAFDVVLDNNGKSLDTVRSVSIFIYYIDLTCSFFHLFQLMMQILCNLF